MGWNKYWNQNLNNLKKIRSYYRWMLFNSACVLGGGPVRNCDSPVSRGDRICIGANWLGGPAATEDQDASVEPSTPWPLSQYGKPQHAVTRHVYNYTFSVWTGASTHKSSVLQDSVLLCFHQQVLCGSWPYPLDLIFYGVGKGSIHFNEKKCR